jgi:dienelactone hydrolase
MMNTSSGLETFYFRRRNDRLAKSGFSCILPSLYSWDGSYFGAILNEINSKHFGG